LTHAARRCAIASYFLGAIPHLRGCYWNALLAVTANATTNALTTTQPHGLANGQTVAMLSGPVGGLPDKDAYGQFQVYFVVGVTATTLQLAYTASGAALTLAAAGGTLAILGDPTTATIKITTPDGAPSAPLVMTKEAAGVYVYDYTTAQRGGHSYEVDGSGGLTAVGKGWFLVQ